MSPDDPRHGSNAGAMRHRRDGERLCDPCAVAASRQRKRSHLDREQGRPRAVPLGERAWRIVHESPRNRLAEVTGIKHDKILRLDKAGPEHVVHRSTRDRILLAGSSWTAIGVQRRLQALTAIGWSMRAVADEAGVDVDSCKKLRRNADPKFVRLRFAEAIIAAYEQLHMKPAPSGASANKTRQEAMRRGYVSPLAWDDIDNDPAPATAPRSARDIDEAVVLRVLAGERLQTSKAEKDEVVRRWREMGKPAAELERRLGWKPERYGRTA